MFSLQKTPIWRENSLYFSGAPQPPPSPVPSHFYADHTPDDELAAQLPAACLTREHQQAAGLALSSLLLLQPKGLGARVGVPAGPGCRRGARGRGVPPGSAHGAAPQQPCFLELCSFDPSGSPCHCTARAPSGSPRPRSLSSPPRSLSPQNEAARVLSPPQPPPPSRAAPPRPPAPARGGTSGVEGSGPPAPLAAPARPPHASLRLGPLRDGSPARWALKHPRDPERSPGKVIRPGKGGGGRGRGRRRPGARCRAREEGKKKMHTQSGARVRGALSEARARGLEAADRGCPGAPDVRASGRFPGNSEPEEGVFSTPERKQILFQELPPSHSPSRPSAHLPSPSPQS